MLLLLLLLLPMLAGFVVLLVLFEREEAQVGQGIMLLDEGSLGDDGGMVMPKG